MSSADDHLNIIIDAYLHDPEFQSALEDIDRRGLVRGKPQAMVINSGCGVAGCAYSALVVQSVTRPGVNPQGFSVLALVNVSPDGRISGVQRVDLKPWEENQLGNDIPDSSLPKIPAEGKIELLPRYKVERLPQIKLEVTSWVPATEPDLAIEMALPLPP